MAGFVPNQWKARLLEATMGKTPILAGTLYLGLAVRVPEDPAITTLANLTEVATAGYGRVAVPPAADARLTAPVQITVPSAFAFPSLTADMNQAATYAFLSDAANGTDGNIRYLWQLATPLLGKAGEPLSVPANTLIIE